MSFEVEYCFDALAGLSWVVADRAKCGSGSGDQVNIIAKATQ